jgi:hypothetical protein
MTAARAMSDPIMRRRRECRSASTPAQSRVASIASDSSASTNPRVLALPVRSVTRQPRATMNAASPRKEIVWPPQSRRKSRLRNAAKVPARAVVVTA